MIKKKKKRKKTKNTKNDGSDPSSHQLAEASRILGHIGPARIIVANRQK